MGLFWDFDNGWTTTKDICLNTTALNLTFASGFNVRIDVPILNGEYVTNFCNQNQFWFNMCPPTVFEHMCSRGSQQSHERPLVGTAPPSVITHFIRAK